MATKGRRTITDEPITRRLVPTVVGAAGVLDRLERAYDATHKAYETPVTLG